MNPRRMPQASTGCKRPLPAPPPPRDSCKRLAAAKVTGDVLRPARTRGPSAEQAKAGPGRGRTYEAAAPAARVCTSLPPIDDEVPVIVDRDRSMMWLHQRSLKAQWQSRVMKQQQERIMLLERLLAEKEAENEAKDATIVRLRARVMELESQLRVAAEDFLSYIKSEPVLKQSSHAQMLEERPEWALILGVGYSEGAQKQSLIYKHLARLLSSLRDITKGDPMKAKELSEMLYLRTHAGEKRKADDFARIRERRRDVAEGIADSVRQFVHALHDAGGCGRYPEKIRQAMQVVATAVSRAAALSKGHTSFLEIGDTLGLSPKLIKECQKRFTQLDDGEWEEIFEERAAIRSDQLDPEWAEFATEFWADPELANEQGEAYNFTRRAESMSKEVRNPKDRSSNEKHRIHWLEESIGVVYETMLERGKQVFGEKFHMSWPYFLNLRPYFVKDATRETCMCVYHMRFDEMASGLLTYRQSLKQHKVCQCSCSIPANAQALRRQLICPRRQSPVQRAAHTLDNLECILQQCEDCKDLKLLTSGTADSMCESETRDTGIGDLALKVRCEMFDKVEYTTKDGSVKVKKDFVSKQLSFSQFKSELQSYWPKFIAHHNDAKWHDDDFVALKNSLPRCHVGLVIDYAENYSHQPRFEHQSKYFSQVQTTIMPVVVMLRVEDAQNIPEVEKEGLIAMFDKHGLPHVISETHFMLSSDMNHDNAFVQKSLDDHIIPYIRQAAPGTTCLHIRSDGCKAQFKCAANFHWISKQLSEGCGLRVNWSFFESCHGKCYCDPEGGTLKNAARHHELVISDRESQLKDSETLFRWAKEDSGLAVPKLPLSQKKGRGIFRRFFYWIPSKGMGAVDRACLPKLTAEGTSKLHEFLDIGVPGTVSSRRAACHRCDNCWAFNRSECENVAFVGRPTELTIRRENVPAAAVGRINRATLEREAVANAHKATVGSVVCIETHKDEQAFPWVIGEVVKALHDNPIATSPYDSQVDPVHFDSIRANEPALEVVLYEALEPGSCTYFRSEIKLLVAARSVRVLDVSVEAVRAAARLHNRARSRFKIADSSLAQIRAAMPTSNDNWKVERLLQYRCLYSTEQWLVKWENFDEYHNSWEPWEHLLTEEVHEEAAKMREDMLIEAADISKFTVVMLKAALANRGLNVNGQKNDLVHRVRDMLGK